MDTHMKGSNMSKETGGPALPSPKFAVPKGCTEENVILLGSTAGMTLRDWFAMQHEATVDKMTGNEAEAIGVPMPLGLGTPLEWLRWRAAARAKLRYIEADAMIRARGEG